MNKHHSKPSVSVPQELPQVPVPEGYRLHDLQLEMSLKPFYDATPETRRKVCEEIFRQWLPIARHSETVSILLWTADGSEILEYDGKMDRPFEWARYQGSANAHEWKLPRKGSAGHEDHNAIGVHVWDPAHDPQGVGLHRRPYLYREPPAEFTFLWLRDLVRDLKRIGRRITGRRVLVGDAFDIGPEFAVSRFKYQWHPEILAGAESLFKGQFIRCDAILHGDDRPYAAFPHGIPEGTPFAVFLGRQLHRFFRDIGFDFVWFSNGFGFAVEPWALIGMLFDGSRFYPEKAAEAGNQIREFWRLFRAVFPSRYPVRTRGTNLCTGIDLGSDASPLRDIYRPELNVDAPVNSPWAALDGDFGLELAGWMSHIVGHPGDRFRFRFYVHDPWWKNSPWLDRFERNPQDLYLPASVSRLGADGRVTIARDVALLTIDDSDGRLPLSANAEVVAHFLHARECAPDDAGPMIWAYPFDDFHDRVEKFGRPDIPFHADFFVSALINEGVPLNTVVDLRLLPAALRARPSLREGRVFFSPVPLPGSDSERVLNDLWREGVTLFLYGPLPAASVFFGPLGLREAAPLEGDFDLELRHVPPGEQMEAWGWKMRHTAMLSGGGFSEAPVDNGPSGVEYLALARRAEGVRVACARNGQLFWTRGSLTTAEYNPDDPQPLRGPILHTLNPQEFVPAGRLTRFALDKLDWRVAVADVASEPRAPCLTIHRHRNAFHYSGFHPDENSRMLLRHPLGAPLLTYRRLRVIGGASEVTGIRAWTNECRVFLASGDDGIHRARYLPPVGYGVYRRLLISGCRHAVLKFMVDPGSDRPIRILRRPIFPYLVGDFVEPCVESTPWGPVITVENVEGTLLLEW